MVGGRLSWRWRRPAPDVTHSPRATAAGASDPSCAAHRGQHRLQPPLKCVGPDIFQSGPITRCGARAPLHVFATRMSVGCSLDCPAEPLPFDPLADKDRLDSRRSRVAPQGGGLPINIGWGYRSIGPSIPRLTPAHTSRRRAVRRLASVRLQRGEYLAERPKRARPTRHAGAPLERLDRASPAGARSSARA
jgi:hypothetical protein